MKFDLISIQARWVLGIIPVDDLPDIAAGALCAGFESKSLLELAATSRRETDETRRLFNRALNELGLEPMSKSDALRLYANYISAAMLASEITPLNGAKQIWNAVLDSGMECFHDLDPFIYAASEMEDRRGETEFFEQEILKEAKRWVTTNGNWSSSHS